MPRRFSPLLMTMGAIALVCSPSAVVAQADAGGWSRIIHAYSPLQCTTERPCTARPGLVWDSTNTFPKYPVVLAGVGVGGEVVVRFRVGEAGAVESGSVAVVNSSNRAFEKGAVDAVSRWRFGVEAEQRPAGPIDVEVGVIFAQMGRCPDNIRRTATGWARSNQLVVTTCHVLIPRDQLRPMG